MRRGSIVTLGENAGEEYVVVHIEFSMAWVCPRRTCSAAGHAIVPLSRLTEVNAVYPSFALRRHGSEL